jgi:hypothetical protein
VAGIAANVAKTHASASSSSGKFDVRRTLGGRTWSDRPAPEDVEHRGTSRPNYDFHKQMLDNID